MNRTVLFFLLVASFGIMFVGCSAPSEEGFDTVSFTEEQAEQLSELLDRIEAEQTGSQATLVPYASGTASVVLDATRAERQEQLRTTTSLSEMDRASYRVTNDFLNVRREPAVSSETVTQLVKGDRLTLLEFVDAAWARVQLPSGSEGYVSTNYIARPTSEAKLPEERKAYEGKYFVDFSFLNVRSAPTTQAEKIGELPANAIITPVAFHGEWARITLGGKEGFASTQYLKPFSPTFLVRQDHFPLPLLHYQLTEENLASFLDHVDLLRQRGITVITLRDFYDLLLRQEERDERLPPGRAVLVISNTPSVLLRRVSEGLLGKGTRATFFLQTSLMDPQGDLPPSLLSTLAANGFDLQSAGHTSDDLRSLTNGQIDEDISQSRQIIEGITGREVFALLYPRGGMNERAADRLREGGFLFGITLTPAPAFDRSQFLKLPSILVDPEGGLTSLEAFLSTPKGT